MDQSFPSNSPESVEQSDHAQKEISSLQEQMSKLKQMLKEAQEQSPQRDEENHRLLTEAQDQCLKHKQRAEKLATLLLEREKKIVDLQQFEYGFRKAQEQRQEIEASAGKQSAYVEALKAEKNLLSKDLEEAKQHSIQLERVINFLRERQEETRLENKQFNEEFQTLRQTLCSLSEKNKTYQDDINALEKLVQQEKLAKQEAFEEVAALQSQFENLKNTIQKNKQELELHQLHLKEAETAAELLQVSLEKKEQLQTEYDSIKTNLNKVQATQEEAESRLKMAQQHLAKKVKENAELDQKLHDRESQIQELQNQLNQSRMKAGELQNSLDLQLQQEKLLQEQLQSSIRSAESLAAKWEDKYFKISEKWQESESKVRELTKLEERYNKLQALLSNLGSVLGSPMGYTPPAVDRDKSSVQVLALPEPPPIQKIYDEEKEFKIDVPPSEEAKPYQNLFDMPQPHQRQKKSSLFD